MKMLLTTFGLLVASPSVQAEEDCFNRLTQDLNCNVIDEVEIGRAHV